MWLYYGTMNIWYGTMNKHIVNTNKLNIFTVILIFQNIKKQVNI